MNIDQAMVFYNIQVIFDLFIPPKSPTDTESSEETGYCNRPKKLTNETETGSDSINK